MRKITFENFINSKSAEIGIDKKTLIARLGVPQATYYRKIHDPGSCPQFMLKRLAEILCLNESDRAQLTRF